MADFLTDLHAWIAPVLSGRLYPRDKVPQKAARPYATYQVISDPRPEHLKGYDRSRQSRVQVDVIAATYGEARGVSEDIIAAVAAPGVHGGTRFGRVKAEGPRDLSEETASGTISKASTDLLVDHKPA